MAEKLQALGVDGVEWRINDDGKHFRPQHLKKEALEIRRISEAHHLDVPILSTYLPVSHIPEIQEVIEAAASIGVGLVRAIAPRYEGELHHRQLYEDAVKNLERLEEITSVRKVKAVLEIHMGSIIPSASAAFGLVRHFDPDCIGVIFDPGNMVWEGMENWRMGLEMLGSYLSHVHVKNSLWSRIGESEHGSMMWKPSMCPLREGIVNWGEVIGSLKKVNYRGYLSIEDFSEELPPEERIQDDLRYLSALERAR